MKNVIYKMCLKIIYLIPVYKKNLTFNDQQQLICHKIKPNLAQLAEAVEYNDCFSVEEKDPPPTSVLEIWLKTIWRWGSSNARTLVNVEYPFIAIVPRSTLARSCSTW